MFPVMAFRGGGLRRGAATARRTLGARASMDAFTPGRRCFSSADASKLVVFGAHRGLSFEEILQQQPKYCQWVVTAAQKEDASQGIRDLAAYVSAQPSSSSAPAARTTSFENAAPKAASDVEAAVTGDATSIVSFGKHSGLTFEEIFAQQPNYCQWVLKKAAEPEASANVKALAAYVKAQPAMPDLKFAKANTYYLGKDSAEDGLSISSGEGKLNFGKYADLTHKEVFTTDPKYCEWLVSSMLSDPKRNVPMWRFTVYIQHQWLKASKELELEASNARKSARG